MSAVEETEISAPVEGVAQDPPDAGETAAAAREQQTFTSLWRNRDFMLLWAARWSPRWARAYREWFSLC